VANKHFAKQAGKFVKHVVPAAVKPVHSLWHEVLGFIFLAVAALGVSYLVRKFSTLGFARIAIIVPLVVVTAIYGVSSFLKARRISRS
jgi:hypothetical protein